MMASTVILGSGIIGLSTAYYLSEHQPGSSIHLVDSSSRLFASASGYAGGFLARDWYPKSLMSLAELSYGEHRKLAEAEGGREKWLYSECVTLAYDPEGKRHDEEGEDWLMEGTSRAGLVEERKDPGNGDVPAWLRRVDGDAVSVVDGDGGTAIVDPLKLCQFLHQKCQAAGVQFHHPATALEIGTDVRGELANVRIGYTDSSTESEIPATRILLASGCWTPQVFATLFNTSSVQIPIASLAGHSLVVRRPDHGEDGKCHAVYCNLETFAPELYSRPNGDLYMAGVNSAEIPLPPLATGAAIVDASLDELKQMARQLLKVDDELEVVRTGLCFRPVTAGGTPFLARLKDEDLGVGIKTRPGQEGGVFVAAGHGPWGICLSLGTGKVMAEMIQGRDLSADISALRLPI